MLARVLAIVMLVALPGPARAGSSDYVIGAGANAHVGAAPDAATLDAYGYDRALPLATGVELWAGYRASPGLEVGTAVGWGYRKLGRPPEATISMRRYARSLGGYLRPRLLGGGAADLGLRIEAGFLAQSIVLRGVEREQLDVYARGRLELDLGRGRVGATLHVEYLHVRGDDTSAPGTRESSFGAGVGVRYRLD